MNASTIKREIKNAGFNLNEWRIEKAYHCYNIILTSFGLSDNERQAMTGEQVNEKKALDAWKLKTVAGIFNVRAEHSSVRVHTELAPSIWK